jgi:hypothetical protein
LAALGAANAGLRAELERERSGYQLEHETAERLRAELAVSQQSVKDYIDWVGRGVASY